MKLRVGGYSKTDSFDYFYFKINIMIRFFTSLILIIFFTVTADAQLNSKDWYNKGLELNDSLKFTDAAKAFEKSIAQDANYAEAYYRAGWTYNELKNYDKAVERLLKAVQLKKEYAFALQELGYAYKKKQNYTEALNYLNQAVTIKPDYAGAYKQLGDVYLNLNRDNEGIAAYEKAYTLDNKQEQACYEAGYWYNGKGNFDKALEWLNKATAIKPTVNSYNELGFAYYSLKRNEEAFAAYKNVLQINPLNGTAYKGMGDVYRRNYSPAKTTEAIENYRMSIQNNPSSSGSYFGIGWCYNELHNYDSSITYLLKALQLDKSITAAYTELGYAQYMKGLNNDALITFDKGLALSPKQKLPLYYKGLVYVVLKDKYNANKIYDLLQPIDASLSDKLLTKINAIVQ
jgi:tetratricopeptide (TPR) repeat protein